jgi:hypothetical protein
LQKPFDVSTFERLYAPLDANGNRLKTINEKAHASVLSRYRKSALVCSVDAEGTCESAVYQPPNLSPLFSSAGTLAEGVAVED